MDSSGRLSLRGETHDVRDGESENIHFYTWTQFTRHHPGLNRNFPLDLQGLWETSVCAILYSHP